MAGICRAGAHTCRLPVFFGKIVIIDAVNTERAFLHHTLGRIQFPRAIRAGPGAQPAPDAPLLIDQHNTVLGTLV